MPQSSIKATASEVQFLWVRRNRGVCSRIARELGCSPEFIRRVLYGINNTKSSGLLVEKALMEAGAPFIEDRVRDITNA